MRNYGAFRRTPVILSMKISYPVSRKNSLITYLNKKEVFWFLINYRHFLRQPMLVRDLYTDKCIRPLFSTVISKRYLSVFLKIIYFIELLLLLILFLYYYYLVFNSIYYYLIALFRKFISYIRFRLRPLEVSTSLIST